MNRGSKRSSMRRSTRYVTSISVALTLLFGVVGCWSSPPSSPSGSPTKPPTETPGEQAERALRGDAPFDLRFPDQTPPRRDVATKAVLAACEARHPPSCWLLLQMATSPHALDVGSFREGTSAHRGGGCEASRGVWRWICVQLQGARGRLVRPRRAERDARQDVARGTGALNTSTSAFVIGRPFPQGIHRACLGPVVLLVP